MSNLIVAETTKEELLKEYKTYPAVDGSLEDKPFYESRYAPIFYEVRSGSKVLDFGCNDGTFMEMLKDKRGCDVTGVDVSDVALEVARKKNLNVLNYDGDILPFEDGTFDYVLCMEVLSHVFDPSKALKEIKRVLKKNGVLLGSCPHKNLETYAWEDKRMHRRYYDVDELHQVLSESFEKNWIKVLNGAQFSMSMAHSFLADQQVEMLFKSGKANVLGWDSALQDKSILRCWFGFTQGPGDVYYRMSAYADKMQKLGAEVHYNPYDENDPESCADWCKKIVFNPVTKKFTNVHIVNQLEQLLKASDMSVFQLTSSRHILLLLTTAKLGVIKKPMWTEMDDWIFDIPSYNLASHPYHPNSELESVAYDQLKLSDGVICSTEYLKNKVNQLFPGKMTYVVKNSLDFDIWNEVKKVTTEHDQRPDLIRIGYTGCENHAGDMEIVKEPIMALLEEFPNLEFISLPRNYDSFKDIKHPRLLTWNAWVGMSKYPNVVAGWEMDIGIAPLRDCELNRAKSNLRWLEYSALNIPTVASDVEPFKKSIKNGHDGIIVGNNKKEWYAALRSLILDKQKRISIGENAYKRVKKEFNMDDVAKSYLSILREIKNDFIRDTGRVRQTVG